mgnify:CR=1 FL=1
MNRMIDILAELGSRLQGFGSDEHTSHVVTEAIELNEWFSREDILMAIDAIREEFLCRENLQQWAAQYSKAQNSATVAIIMAGADVVAYIIAEGLVDAGQK